MDHVDYEEVGAADEARDEAVDASRVDAGAESPHTAYGMVTVATWESQLNPNVLERWRVDVQVRVTLDYEMRRVVRRTLGEVEIVRRWITRSGEDESTTLTLGVVDLARVISALNIVTSQFRDQPT